MKTAIKAGLLFVMAFAVISCNPIKFIGKKIDEIQVVANPKVLEVHGGKIDYSLKGKIPSKVFHRKALVTLTPVFYYNGGKFVELESLKLKGEKAEGEGRVMSYDNGGSFELEGEIDYKDEMEGKGGYIDLKIKVCKDADNCGEFLKEKLAIGLITTSLSVKASEKVVLFGQGGKVVEADEKLSLGKDFKPAKRNFKGSVYFLINSSYLRPSEKSGESVAELKKFVQLPRLSLNGITINSYASPDGELRLNQNLTKRRSESTYSYLTREMRRLDVSFKEEDLFKKQALEEDWDGLKRLVSASDLPDKSQALSIITSARSVEDKEAELRKLDSWETILDEIMPKLRRSDMILNGQINNRSFEELKKESENGLESFTLPELMLYASMVESVDEKVKAYKQYIAKKPNGAVGYNNLAAIYIMQGNHNEARSVLLDGVENTGGNDSLQNNLGIVYKRGDDLESAKTSYSKAQSAGIESANYNEAIINVIEGDYESAAENMPEACDYNSALVALLNNNYEDAGDQITCSKDITADMHYLHAVINARKGDVDAMAASLRQAVEKDNSLATKATNNLEFHSYFERAEFKNALNR